MLNQFFNLNRRYAIIIIVYGFADRANPGKNETDATISKNIKWETGKIIQNLITGQGKNDNHPGRRVVIQKYQLPNRMDGKGKLVDF